MAILPTVKRQHRVQDDNDVIVLRQSVRQLSRSFGLGLIEQAKVTAAISSVGRGLLMLGCCSMFQVGPINHPLRDGLEITCLLVVPQGRPDAAELEQQLHLGEVRFLVDLATLTITGNAVQITLQVWVGGSKKAI